MTRFDAKPAAPVLAQAVNDALFVASPQQDSFFNWVTDGVGSVILEAVAGSGKTTTLIKALGLMKGFVFFGAYNKKIADEIKQRAPQRMGLFISTMHSAGLKAWYKFAPKVKVDDNKSRKQFRDMIANKMHLEGFEGVVCNLVSLAKQKAIGVDGIEIDDVDAWLELIAHYDIDCLGDENLVIKMAQALLRRSIKSSTVTVDFDDMIYAPLVCGANFYKHDWVLIDEAQDTNRARRLLALRLLKLNGRLVAVGDPHQAIYGFTGADADALDLIAVATKAARMPLSVSYRCPINVVKYAQQYVSHIEAHPDAPEGIVRSLGDAKLTASVVPGDVILCRFNAPIIENAYALIAEGIPAKVEGREIGEGLIKLINRWNKVRSFDDLYNHLDEHFEKEAEKLRAKEQEQRIEALADKIQCIKVLANRVATIYPDMTNPVEVLVNEIKKMFDEKIDGKKVVTLSTGHKAKGREWDRVFWIQTGPSKFARQPWELAQETNLCYVMTTRAKRELVLC